MRKKLREVQYFLAHMGTVAQRVVGDAEEFEFLLSAFLSASRSITDPLESRRYRSWFDAWQSNRTDPEKRLLEFMRVQRNSEVHRDGANVEVELRWVPITEIRADRHGHPAYGFHWFSPPGIPPPSVGMNVHQFELGGTQVEAFGTCRDFGTLLRELIEAFQADHPAA